MGTRDKDTKHEPEKTMTEFYAIRKNSPRDGGHFFSWKGEEFFATREELEQAINEWKKTVTPNTAERTIFVIHQS